MALLLRFSRRLFCSFLSGQVVGYYSDRLYPGVAVGGKGMPAVALLQPGTPFLCKTVSAASSFASLFDKILFTSCDDFLSWFRVALAASCWLSFLE